MISALLAMWGTKLGKWLIEIALIVAVVLGAYAYVHHQGASDELVKLRSSSASLVKSANENIAKETAAHAADNAANQEKVNAALQANAVIAGDRDQRVRDFDAYRRAHPDVPRTGGGPSAAQPGECGATSCGDLASRLAKTGNELAASQGQLIATLEGCQRDRDSLTGLPKELK